MQILQWLQMRGIEVLYEDNHLIAVNKSTNLLVHGDSTGDETLEEQVKKYIKIKYDKPGDVYLGVLHRLDRMVSGVVLFARTSKAAERMSRLIQDRKFFKTYYAITENPPEELSGTLRHYITKDHENNIVKAHNKEKPGSKEAILHYECIGQLGTFAMLKINLVTGRPHQIRVQLKKIACPIVGDKKYGSKMALPDGALALHCRSISFEHPIKKEMVNIIASFPTAEIWKEYGEIAKQYESDS